MPSTRRAPRPRGYRYPRLDLSGVRFPPNLLVGTHGRAEAVRVARAAGYPAEAVTPALTTFSRVYVVQLDGDPDAGTVTLATTDHAAVTLTMAVEVRYRIVAPSHTERMLAAVRDEYPDTSLTAALAEALAAVLHRCDRQRGLAIATVKIADLTESLAPPLNAFLTPWATERPSRRELGWHTQ